MNRKIQSQIDSHSIPLKEHTIIYHFLDDVKECLSDLLPPIPVTSVSGEAQILAIFQLSGKKANKVAGCKVQTGKILGDNRIKVLRQGEVLFDGMFLQALR